MIKDVNEILKLAKEYYLIEGNSIGGSLHIVLDDGNIEDDNIKFCINYAKQNDDIKGVELAELILQCSYTQRKKLYRKLHEEENK